jgi:uncharacterized protein YggE
MWNMSAQLIEQPFGIAVFGSAIMRVSPDVASITVAVGRMENKARDAFAKARKGSESVTSFLRQAHVSEFGSSRITLNTHYAYEKNVNTFKGYVARISYNVVLRDLDRTEEILSGLIEAGASEVQSVTFQTSRLKELRAEVRQQAVAAAREKALNYCAAASVTLGRLLHIDDVDPNAVSGRAEGHSMRESATVDESPEIKAFDPGAITVAGAVKLAYAIGAE